MRLLTAGALGLDGTEVTADQEVTRAQLDAGQLTDTPPPNANGTGYASFTFKVSDGVAATPTVAAADATITIAADAEKATGKIDWVHYMLSHDGDPASAVTVPVTFDGFAGND